MEAEKWRAVVGFAGEYEVSDHGRVRSLDRVSTYRRVDQYSGRLLTIHRRRNGCMLRPGPKVSGHLTVALGRGGSRQVHALVLEAFVGPRPHRHEARHLDDDPRNNHLANLRWGTRSENLHDAVRNGKKPVGERHHGAKLKDADIPTIRSFFGALPYAEIARRYGVTEATIRQIKDGRSWKGQ